MSKFKFNQYVVTKVIYDGQSIRNSVKLDGQTFELGIDEPTATFVGYTDSVLGRNWQFSATNPNNYAATLKYRTTVGSEQSASIQANSSVNFYITTDTTASFVRVTMYLLIDDVQSSSIQVTGSA